MEESYKSSLIPFAHLSFQICYFLPPLKQFLCRVASAEFNPFLLFLPSCDWRFAVAARAVPSLPWNILSFSALLSLNTCIMTERERERSRERVRSILRPKWAISRCKFWPRVIFQTNNDTCNAAIKRLSFISESVALRKVMSQRYVGEVGRSFLT